MIKNTQKTLDTITRLICKEKQKEIDSLKAYIKKTGEEGRELSVKYSHMWHSNNGEPRYFMPHDLFDFLQSI